MEFFKTKIRCDGEKSECIIEWLNWDIEATVRRGVGALTILSACEKILGIHGYKRRDPIPLPYH